MDKQTKIRIATNTAIISSIFALLMGILMLFNYLQISSNDPIESVTLKTLVERLNSDPNNQELLQEIRAFDLMARKAYFTSKWQIETSGILLLLSAIVLIISLRSYFNLTSKIEEPETDTMPDTARRLLSSKWILGTGTLFIVLALLASFLSVNHLNEYQPNGTATAAIESTDETIEMVDISSSANEQPKIEETSPAQEEPKTEVTASETKTTEPETSKPEAVQKNFPSMADLKKQSNSFRGPLGNGVWFAKNIPTKWDATTNIKWKAKVPKPGYNSPVIWGDKLFVTGADAKERWLYCYDRNTGKLLWQHHADNIAGSPATAPKTTDDTGLAAPSVTTDGKLVTAIFGTGDIVTCDMMGNRVWAKNLGVPDNHYGHSSSLIYWQGKIFVQYDTNKGGRLFALDITYGEMIWDTKRTSHISWASPILAEIDGKMQIITTTEPTVAGYDAETGKELWKNDCMMGEVGPSPAFSNGLVFVGNEYATLAAIDPGKGSIVWQSDEYLPEVASPVVSDGLLFVVTSYGLMACYDIHTGNKYWEQDFGQSVYSSPVIADGNVYLADMKGTVHVMKVAREAEVVSTNPIGETVATTPAFSDGCIYIRGKENLYCIGK